MASLVGCGATKTFHASGISFDYPAGWDLHDQMPGTLGFGQEIAIVGTLPWGPCQPSDINCHYQERLDRGQIEIGISAVALRASDFCAYAQERPDLAGSFDPIAIAGNENLRIAGRPAVRTDYAVAGQDYYLSDEWRIWQIAFVDTVDRVYRIDAKYRGPSTDALRAAADRLVASIRLDPQSGVGVPGGADCGAPFPAP
jgi:hypothetical protein